MKNKKWKRLRIELKEVEQERRQIQKLEKDLHLQRSQMEKDLRDYEKKYEEKEKALDRERELLQLEFKERQALEESTLDEQKKLFRKLPFLFFLIV